MTREELDAIRKRMAVQRPLHWGDALRLIEEIEALHADLAAAIAKIHVLEPREQTT